MVKECVEADTVVVDIPERCHPAANEGVQKGEAGPRKVGQVT